MLSCYPVANKKKSFDICLAFARGAGGSIATNLREGAAFFYGVDSSNVAEWNAVRANKQEFFYSDNSYFDCARQKQFRVARNRLQHTGVGRSDGVRLLALGVEMAPWRASGAHIVVCPQSAAFMRTVAGIEWNWTANVLATLRRLTDREIRVRSWSADKGALSRTLEQDLIGAHALVTWSSAAAVSAVLTGVPVVVMSKDCAARPMAGDIEQIESLPTPERAAWASVLADAQWSIEEFLNGTAWRALHEATE